MEAECGTLYAMEKNGMGQHPYSLDNALALPQL